jgi:pyridoxine 5-phosphate synthase
MGRTKLSVNINKYALLRNSRGHDAPNLCASADLAIAAGCHGITVHPRLDERHVRMDDLPILTEHLRTRHPDIEFNIECQDDAGLLARVLDLQPDQCTLVPVTPGEVTSDHGWHPIEHRARLQAAIAPFTEAGIRVSCFADCEPDLLPAFRETGTDRVELYTGPYAWAWGTADQSTWVERIRRCIRVASDAGLGVNAGHDLDRHNLAGIADEDGLLEVSIGHAQICRALEVGTRQSVSELLEALGW